MSVENLQKNHYEKIASEYSAHYGDEWSQRYRQTFFNQPLTQGLSLQGKTVVEAMCASGETTGFLLERGARVIGLDISEREIAEFRRRWPQCQAICASILDTGLPAQSCDCVVVVGGLHHTHPFVTKAVEEILRILKPGGYFCFVEPHRGSILDRVRSLWYRHDPYFASNEAAIDLDRLKASFADSFEFLKEEYKGSIAYLFVLNSLVWRVPVRAKRWYAPLLLQAERLADRLLTRSLSCYVVAQWRKRSP